MPNIAMISLDSQHDWTGKALVSQAHSGFEKEGRTTLRGDLDRTKGEKDAFRPPLFLPQQPPRTLAQSCSALCAFLTMRDKDPKHEPK